MTTPDLLALLLALSTSVHIGCAAAFTAWRGGSNRATALLIGGSAAGTTCALYLAAVSAYG